MDTIMKIWLFYGILSAILMVTLLILLNTNKLFVHSFYRIISMDILLNLLCWINTWPNRIVYRMDTAGFVLFLYENAHSLLEFSSFLAVAFFHIQSLSSIMICVHRLTTAVFSSSDKFWSRWYFLVYTLVIAYSCFASSLIKLPTIQYNYETKEFIEAVLPHETGLLYGVIILLFMIVYLVILMSIGLTTIIQVRKRLGNHAEQQKELLRRMSKIAILNNCIYAIFLFWYFIASWQLKPKMEFMLTASDLVSSEVYCKIKKEIIQMTFSISYIMLFLDRNVRMALKNSVVPESFTRLYNARVSTSNGRQNGFMAA
uniref:Serpentine receptor class gamma n=1 Tax=Caenorhabditis tropicalis TaxID=1561998 RepID=A0A1I7U9N4_9PELO